MPAILARTTPSFLLSDHELQSGPHIVDRTDFDIDKPQRQGDRPNGVFGDIGRHTGRSLRPRQPDGGVVPHFVHRRLKETGKLPLLRHKCVDEVNGLIENGDDFGAFGQRRDEQAVFLWRVGDENLRAGLDAKLRGQGRSGIAGHRERKSCYTSSSSASSARSMMKRKRALASLPISSLMTRSVTI